MERKSRLIKTDTSLSRLKAGARGQGKTTSVPIFVGIDSVSIRKRLDITGIVRKARDRLADFYAENMRSE
jgi:hypothetical protein